MPFSPEPHRVAGEPTALIRDFGRNLRGLREKAGLTPEDLAQKAEIGVDHLIELEEADGEAIASIGVVLRLAGALDHRPSELVQGVEWVPFQITVGRGYFEVMEDPDLTDEIVTLEGQRLRERRGGRRRL
jgi:transcriptional regulator with XRE-family HTH domain